MELDTLGAARCLAVIETYLVEEIADMQHQALAGVPAKHVRPVRQTVADWLGKPAAATVDPHGIEAQRAQAAAEAMFPPADGDA